MSVKIKQEELYQWGIMVGTPSTLETSRGQYSYVELVEDSHSLCVPL
jgi:hypothetical protein